MHWTWEKIQDEWIGAPGGLADLPEVVVAAFERVEAHFGSAWMDARRTTGGVRASGLAPTLGIVVTGRLLKSLAGVSGAQPIIAGLRDRKEDAMAEALAIHLLAGHPEAGIEYEPLVKVGGRDRKPDLRARCGPTPWVYAEVAKPNDSELKRGSMTVMRRLAAQVQELSGSFAAEIFLRRRPSFSEVTHIREVLSRLSRITGPSEVGLPDGLGRVFLNSTEPGCMVLDDHGEGYRPGIGIGSIVVGHNEHRHVHVRLAYSDPRADQFLRNEARQLPPNYPGIVMLYTGRATGAMHSWASVMASQLQPAKHTRVGAVCLFEAGLTTTAAGEAWRVRTQLIANPHASNPLPEWVLCALRSPAEDTQG